MCCGFFPLSISGAVREPVLEARGPESEAGPSECGGSGDGVRLSGSRTGPADGRLQQRGPGGGEQGRRRRPGRLEVRQRRPVGRSG